MTHHAYLLEGDLEQALPEIKRIAGENFSLFKFDSLKIEDARYLKSLSFEKGDQNSKNIFVISANSILLEAQNTLLKMFEEPIENTHFFVIVPDTGALLKTFLSRFYIISHKSDMWENTKEAEEFIKMTPSSRIEFIKKLLEENLGDLGEEPPSDAPRSKALKFLNSLELALYSKMSKAAFDTQPFDQIFKVRKYLRMPGSSAKTLMESLALLVPNF